MQRINISKNIKLDPLEQSLCLRYAEILELRKAIRKERSTLASKKPKLNDAKRIQIHGK